MWDSGSRALRRERGPSEADQVLQRWPGGEAHLHPQPRVVEGLQAVATDVIVAGPAEARVGQK